MSTKNTRNAELRQTNTGQIDKHTQKHRKMSIETNCRLTENTETNVRNMSGQNVRKMPVHQKCAKNAFRECPTNAWRPKMSKTCFQKCPRHALSTNKSKKKIRTFLSMGHAWARFERYQKGHFWMYAHEHDLGLISEPKNKYYFSVFFISMQALLWNIWNPDDKYKNSRIATNKC